MYIDNHEQQQVINGVQNIITNLDPNKDLIHTVDRSTWAREDMDNRPVFSRGIHKTLKSTVKGFLDRRGIVIFEYTDPQVALLSCQELL